MTIQDFLKQKQEKLAEKTKSKKKDFRARCEDILEQIKTYNEEKHSELLSTFKARYDKVNIQKKKILGFYGQLVNELKSLKEQAGESILSTPVLKKAKSKINDVKKKKESVTKKASKATKKKVAKKTTKKDEKDTSEDKKVAKKKVAKKATKKAETSKKASAKKKVTKKTTATKTTKKATAAKKKTTTAKKTVAKKTTKKVTKKTTK